MLTLGVKGLLYVELECVAAGSDSHSSYAPVVSNPAWRLVWALNTLKDASENVMLRGFYDRVRPALENEVEALKGLPDEVDRFKEYFGVEMFLGEASGYEFRRKLLMDPTCNIAGIDSGYTGGGSKTVLPAVAKMKIDFRLVPDQSPDEVAASLRTHLDERGFSDISIKIMGSEHPARTSIDHSWVKLVGNAAQSVYGVAPYLQPNMTGTGPQYPIQELLSVPVASCGVDYPGNRMHAPNENIRRDYFRMGMLHTAEVLAQFGKQAHV
jgi:acetylornithine deacetylase/succinyl-diaminopimelate desuccinylase-like protein